jgi:hypothetical protein
MDRDQAEGLIVAVGEELEHAEEIEIVTSVEIEEDVVIDGQDGEWNWDDVWDEVEEEEDRPSSQTG